MVASCPPPGVPVETKTLANLPAKAPLAQRPPVASQKTYENEKIKNFREISGSETYFPLSGEIAITGRNAEDKGVKVGQFGRGDDGITWLCGSIHLCEDFRGQCFSDPG